MGRDSNGNYSSPSGPFVSGTTIDSSVVNGKLNDIGSEITNSLDRNGQGGMLTYLRGVDGTVNLPAYSFTGETTLGFMRFGSGDLRAVKDGTSLMKWSTSEVRVYSAGVFEKGATVTNSTANGSGLTTTGNGSGSGLVATGGATGAGVTATGGASGAVGGAFAGTVNNVAATFQGHGSAAGLSAAGGATGPGISAVGGVTSGVGGTFSAQAGNSAGVAATGHGTGVGGLFAAGTASTGADPTVAVELTNGHLKLSGTAPNKDEALANTLTPANVNKAWGKISTTAGGFVAATIDDAFNVASATVDSDGTTTVVTVTFAQTMANDDYAIILTGQRGAGTTGRVWTVASQAAGSFTANCTELGNPPATETLNSVARTFYFSVQGRQA